MIDSMQTHKGNAVDMEQGDSLCAYKAWRIEQDRRKIAAMTSADQRIRALEIALQFEVAARQEAERKLAKLSTAPSPMAGCERAEHEVSGGPLLLIDYSADDEESPIQARRVIAVSGERWVDVSELCWLSDDMIRQLDDIADAAEKCAEPIRAREAEEDRADAILAAREEA